MNMKTGAIGVALLIAAVTVPAVRAEEADAPAEKKLAPYFFVVNGDPSIAQVPLKAKHMDVAVSGVVADVRVTQVYHNRGTRPITARYVFPGSTRAAVHGMR